VYSRAAFSFLAIIAARIAGEGWSPLFANHQR
jgi:hypothetical protein